MLLPLQGEPTIRCFSQGVALGYWLLAFQAVFLVFNSFHFVEGNVTSLWSVSPSGFAVPFSAFRSFKLP